MDELEPAMYIDTRAFEASTWISPGASASHFSPASAVRGDPERPSRTRDQRGVDNQVLDLS